MSCPQNMADISAVFGDCMLDTGQAVVVLFQKIYSSGTTKNKVAIADADDIATWSALLAAADETKIVATKKIGGGKVEAGEVIEFGGGNETPEGAVIPMGKKPSKFTATMFNSKQEAIEALKLLENIDSGLGVYFATHKNEIYGLLDGTDLVPIPIIGAPYFLDASAFSREDPISNKMGFSLPENWSDKISGVVCEGIKDIKAV